METTVIPRGFGEVTVKRKIFPKLEAIERIIRENREFERNPSFCPNCGERGSHFVPPNFGDNGFYICVKK